MPRFNFCSGSYTLQSPILDGESLVNGYCEQPESLGASSPIAIMHTPGLKVFCTLPETAVSSDFTVNGRTFACGASFYEIYANKSYTKRGTLNGPPLSPTQIFSCQTHLLILSNGELFIFVLTAFTDSNGVLHAANSFVAVDMAQLNGPVLQIEFCDGYFFAAIQNSNTFQVSNLEDATTWSGLFISTISYFPDNITSLKVDHREVGFFSGKKTIVYYNSGAGYPPFIPIQGGYLEDGCAAAFATTQIKDTVCWISQNERGAGVAKMMSGTVGQRISTLAVEFAWQSYSRIDDAIGYAYQDQGHDFWVVRFPTPSKTWVYDFATSLWHERAFWNAKTGTYSQHRSTCHTFNFGKHLVGDPQSGNIYEMSIDIYDYFGNMIRGMRRSPTVSEENEWIYFNSIEFLPEVGLGPIPPLLDGDGQPRGPQVMLRWSDDGGKIWSNTYYLDCGQAGEYNKRVRMIKLGRARKRVWELSWTDPIPWSIVDAFLQSNPPVEQAKKAA